MKYILTFEDSHNKSHYVGEVDNLGDEYQLIHEEIKKRNPNFKVYYIRTWGNPEKEGMMYDVGSHTEFFKLTRKIEEKST